MTKIDTLDKDIVETLQENARLTNAELEGQLGVSEATVRRGIDKLLFVLDRCNNASQSTRR